LPLLKGIGKRGSHTLGRGKTTRTGPFLSKLLSNFRFLRCYQASSFF
jgi:hypothetical protein